MDPATGELYATSFNDCPGEDQEDFGCWGNGRIDRYSFDANTITHEGVAYLAQHPLRARRTTFDSDAGLLTAPILNEGFDPITIETTTLTSDSTVVSLESACDGSALAPGDSCDLVFRGVTEADDVEFEIATTDGNYSSEIQYVDALDAFMPDGMDHSGGTELAPPCTNASGTFLQNGNCAMTALAFSGDGERLFANEDDLDQGLVFDKSTEGRLAFVRESNRNFSLQGLASNPAGDVVYNGSNTYSVTGDGEMTRVNAGDGGNATEPFSFGGTSLLATTLNNSTLDIFDLTAPLVPEPVATLAPSVSEVRFQDHSADGTRFVVSGIGSVASIAFDGTTLIEQDALPVDVFDPDDCPDCNFTAITRKIQVTSDGAFALAGTFVVRYNDEAIDTIPFQGLLNSYSIDPATGKLQDVGRIELQGKVRAILAVQAP